MIRVGDYVRIREEFNNMYWYTNEVYQVMNVSGESLTLDRKLPTSPLHEDSPEKERYKIHDSNVEIDLKTSRYYKLKKLFDK